MPRVRIFLVLTSVAVTTVGKATVPSVMIWMSVDIVLSGATHVLDVPTPREVSFAHVLLGLPGTVQLVLVSVHMILVWKENLGCKRQLQFLKYLYF